jgi:Ca-activated chloride channel family protein
LEYPGRSLGWSDIFQLVNNSKGWGAKGAAYNDWGPFRLGKTNPTISTSGLNALMATYYASGAVPTIQGVKAPEVRSFVGGIEKGVAHYGRTARQFLTNMQISLQGPPPYYVSAIAIEEQELVMFNETSASLLVPIYPRDGTLVDDHPYVLLNWSRPKQALANDFYNFVETNERGAIDRNGFRDENDYAGPDLAQRLQETGVNPYQVLKIDTPPSGQVLDGMINEWKMLRNSVRVLILIDTAVTTKTLNSAIHDLRMAAGGFEPQDQVAIGTFPTSQDGYTSLLPLTGVSETSVSPSCGSRAPTFLDNALASIHTHGVATVGSLPAAVDAALHNMSPIGRTSVPIVAILLVELSRGLQQPIDDGIERTLRQPNETVRLFTIGPANDPRLKALSAAGRGLSYTPGATCQFLEDLISTY